MGVNVHNTYREEGKLGGLQIIIIIIIISNIITNIIESWYYHTDHGI